MALQQTKSTSKLLFKLTLSATKTQLFKKCTEIIEARILELKVILQEAQDAANNETKSSAGDKHETGRAMAQLETEKLTAQLSEALNLKATLSKINTKETLKQIALGSVVFTNNGNFYVSVSLGKLEIEQEQFFAISPQSPIGKLLLTKKEKASFSLNGNTYVIENIF